MTTSQVTLPRDRLASIASPTPRWDAPGVLVAAELIAGAAGFATMVLLARRLGPSGYASLEYATAASAWWLVVVRGGFDAIVYREAARRPRLIGPMTDLLLGLRLAGAGAGFAAVLVLAMLAGPGRGWPVAIAGVMLVPAAFAADVGLRSRGRWGGLALAQAARAVGLLMGSAWLVRGEGSAAVAAGCVVGAEVVASAIPLLAHRSEFGWPRPRLRPRAWRVLARRGILAGLGRFGRVTLYAADLMALGAWAGPGVGSYAAARRIGFALLALGLVVPATMAPRMARAWVAGGDEARELLSRTIGRLLLVAAPAAVGLALTADRWMPTLFGDAFRDGGPYLALVAVRLPFVLASNVQTTALVACRREASALLLTLAMVAFGLMILPASAYWLGPIGVAWAALGVEVAGAIGGQVALLRLGIVPSARGLEPVLAGCLGLAAVCRVGHGWPLGVVVLAGATTYATIAMACGGRLR